MWVGRQTAGEDELWKSVFQGHLLEELGAGEHPERDYSTALCADVRRFSQNYFVGNVLSLLWQSSYSLWFLGLNFSCGRDENTDFSLESPMMRWQLVFLAVASSCLPQWVVDYENGSREPVFCRPWSFCSHGEWFSDSLWSIGFLLNNWQTARWTELQFTDLHHPGRLTQQCMCSTVCTVLYLDVIDSSQISESNYCTVWKHLTKKAKKRIHPNSYFY